MKDAGSAVTVPSFAKLNLDLRVLGKRPDGFHELRTVFQTISLRDSIEIEFRKAKTTRIELESSVEIPDNLVVRAARAVLYELGVKAEVRFRLQKRIPMGAGMGGGSSNAASALIALAALSGKRPPWTKLVSIAEKLGSDVPFFLYGGTALGIGRGTELYPLPDVASRNILVVSPGIHISTAEAYGALGRGVTNALTSEDGSPILREFQSIAWSMGNQERLGELPLKNDFEKVVWKAQPQLAAIAGKLRRLGAKRAMMTGSGSTLFGVFESGEAARKAEKALAGVGEIYPCEFVNRRRYRAAWRKALGGAASYF